MLLPRECPICGSVAIEPILQRVTVVAEYDGFAGAIGGLKMYKCKLEGHVFFVRTADLERATTVVRAS